MNWSLSPPSASFFPTKVIPARQGALVEIEALSSSVLCLPLLPMVEEIDLTRLVIQMINCYQWCREEKILDEDDETKSNVWLCFD
ncbi:hypothetical protein YC2023_088993 [Brassica napus]